MTGVDESNLCVTQPSDEAPEPVWQTAWLLTMTLNAIYCMQATACLEVIRFVPCVLFQN